MTDITITDVPAVAPVAPQASAHGRQTPAEFHRWWLVKNGDVVRGNVVGVTLMWLLMLALSLFSFFGVLVLMVANGYGGWSFVGALAGGASWLLIPSKRGVWGGKCPHCDNGILLSGDEGGNFATGCPICTKRVFLTGGKFRAV